MNINEQYQSLHLSNSNNQWIEKQILEKDILLLFYQLSNYSYIMGDLNYTELYPLDYWKYLDADYWNISISDDDKTFIDTGCMIIIAAMAWEIIDGSGTFLSNKLDIVYSRVSEYIVNDTKTDILKEMLLRLLVCAKAGNGSMNDLMKESVKMHRDYVRQFFRDKVNEFDNNDYYLRE